MGQPAAPNRAMTALEWTMLVALSVLWGGSFFFNGVAVKALPPLTVVTLRVGLAAFILNLVLPATGARMPTSLQAWRAFVAMGFLNNAVPFTLYVWAQTHITSALASILNATTPLFGVVVAHLFTGDEKMSANRLAGVFIGFAGVAVMIGPVALSGLGGDMLAEFACLAAALIYGFAGVYGRRFKAMGITPMQTAAGQVTASTLMLAPLALIVERPWTLPMPGLAVWGAVIGLTALSTALAYVLYFRILATAGATNLLLVTFLIPVSAVLLGTQVLGERLEPMQLAGMAIIGLGLAAIDGRLWRMADGRRRAAARP